MVVEKSNNANERTHCSVRLPRCRTQTHRYSTEIAITKTSWILHIMSVAYAMRLWECTHAQMQVHFYKYVCLCVCVCLYKQNRFRNVCKCMEKLLENRQKKTGSRIINGNPYFCCVTNFNWTKKIKLKKKKRNKNIKLKCNHSLNIVEGGHTIQIGM